MATRLGTSDIYYSHESSTEEEREKDWREDIYNTVVNSKRDDAGSNLLGDEAPLMSLLNEGRAWKIPQVRPHFDIEECLGPSLAH